MRTLHKILSVAGMGVLAAAPGAFADPSQPINGRNGPASRPAVAPAVAAPLPNPQEQLFVPIRPCRAFFSPTAMTNNQTRNFQITGSSDFSGQGGPTTGCGVPASATGVAVTLTAASPAGTGTLRAFASGVATPVTTSVTYAAGGNATAGTVSALSTAGQMALYLKGASTKVVGDITGYYLPQIQVYMNYDGTAYSATSRIIATSKLGTGSYKIDVDRNVQLCSIHANIDGGYYYVSAYPSGSSIYVSTWAISSGSAVATDLYHNVSAKC